MEDDGLVLSLGIKSFEKKPPQTPPPPSLPPVLTPPLKHSSSDCCRRLSPERLGCKNSIFYKVDHFHKPPPEVGGSKTKQLAPYKMTQNLGWISAKPKPRHNHKGLDRDISKFLAPNTELSMCVAAGKRSAEREVIISDGEDGGDADHRGDVGVGVAAGCGDGGPEKKKLRLSKEQSSLLEQTFLENSTLNNKQKLYLAKELKLMPRQVEVWFQNRRARTKLKQTEMDCEFLREYCKRLSDENRRLHNELQQLTPPSALVLCHACNRGSATPTPSSAAEGGRPRRTIGTTIGPVDQPNLSGLFFNKASLLKI